MAVFRRKHVHDQKEDLMIQLRDSSIVQILSLIETSKDVFEEIAFLCFLLNITRLFSLIFGYYTKNCTFFFSRSLNLDAEQRCILAEIPFISL